ncbi:exosome complex component RRP40 [Nematocida major]|uniref:exosome complex component RRP40 n=1 Tax=Nematocida major TaxID=1912982 RepID=UPI0020085EFB|nr:exosome complex component RRP40 [Nematocida major]KAH9387317.1 exosome complex component RRP40 [Nematocida major]
MILKPGEEIKTKCHNVSVGIKHRRREKAPSCTNSNENTPRAVAYANTGCFAGNYAGPCGELPARAEYISRLAEGDKESEYDKVSSAIGELLSLDKRNYWVNYKQYRYMPLLDDIVLGVVKGKGKESYKVDIGAPSYATINCLDFPSATKRNRVNLSVGDVILAQVVDDSAHAECIISCRTEAVRGMGVLKEGALLKVGILQARKCLLHPPNLAVSGSTVFSMNGFAWVSPPGQGNIREILGKV